MSGAKTLNEYDAKRLLASYGAPVVREEKAGGADEAARAAHAIGFPVVLKGCGADFAHKTELGLVHLNLRNEDAVRKAACATLAAIGARGELLVQAMVSGKREFLAGLSRDPQFGPIVTFGLGGIFAEVLADVTFRVCPVDESEALAMLDDIRGKALLGPVRGLPAVDRNALSRVLLALSRIAADRADIEAIDINPLIVDGADPIAVDALVILR